MKKKRRFKVWLLSGVLLVSFACHAQSGHKVEVQLDTVTKTDFYRIILPPRLVAKCRPDLADLRVRGADGEINPYVLSTDVGNSLRTDDLPIPDPAIRQKDSSNKHSYISLSYPDAYRIERLSLVIQKPILYKRTAKIYDPGESGFTGLVATIGIDPSDTVFRIPAVKTRNLLIDISNADNAPLVISRVISAQSGIYILTHLEKGGVYRLETGDSLAQKPDYDLHYFTDSLKKRPLDIGMKDIRPSSSYPDPARRLVVLTDSGGIRFPVRVQENTRSTVVLWSVLVLVLLLLIYFSVKMVKAIAKKNQNDRL